MKTLAIMQPYFFPYVGYYALINHVDNFILLDDVQFIRHGWVDRNRILKQGGGINYIRPAVQKASHTSLIQDVTVDNSQRWQSRLISQLDVYRRRAPFFFKVRSLVEKILNEPYERLVDLNFATLKGVFQYLDMPFRCEIFSLMDLRIDPPAAPGDWALNICTAVRDVDTYLNPINGSTLFDKEKYKEAGVDLRFFDYKPLRYDQKISEFESSLSIIDVLMFNSPDEVVAMFSNFDVVSPASVPNALP